MMLIEKRAPNIIARKRAPNETQEVIFVEAIARCADRYRLGSVLGRVPSFA